MSDSTEQELLQQVEDEILENSLSDLEKLRRDNPTLDNAWQQIMTVRALTEQQKANDNRLSWERHYFDLVEGRHYFDLVEGVTTNNLALKEAWDQYYTLKMLITGK